MGSRKGKPNKLTQAVRDRVEQAFNTVNGPANAGLIALAREEPAIFYGLVSKCIPTLAAIDIHHHAVNLGLEMRRAADALDRLGHAPPMIDVTPDIVVADTAAPDTVAPDTVPDDPGEGEPGDV